MAILTVENNSGFIEYGTGTSGGSGGSGGRGGIGGGGRVWSSCSQVIWISAGGIRYPVYLKPGWNEIQFWVPSIFPDDTWIETQIIIETEGYILIPAGFEWSIITGEDAPKKLGNKKMADKLEFIDTYRVEIYSSPKPVDVDNILDELGINDFALTEIISVAIRQLGKLDEITYNDIHDIEIQSKEQGEIGKLDEITYNDIHDIEIQSKEQGEIGITDNAKIVDLVNTDVINIKITDKNDGIESTGFSDIFDIEI